MFIQRCLTTGHQKRPDFPVSRCGHNPTQIWEAKEQKVKIIELTKKNNTFSNLWCPAFQYHKELCRVKGFKQESYRWTGLIDFLISWFYSFYNADSEKNPLMSLPNHSYLIIIICSFTVTESWTPLMSQILLKVSSLLKGSFSLPLFGLEVFLPLWEYFAYHCFFN